MTTRWLGVAAALCALSVASVAAAQEAPEDRTTGLPALPARVRLTTADGRRLSFDLLRVDAEGLVGRQAGRLAEPERTVPFDQVVRAELSLGRRRKRNAMIGALVGGAVGAIFLGAANGSGGEGGCNVGLSCLVLFVLPPAAVGAGVGAAVSSERWEPVSLGAWRMPSARGGAADRPRALALKFTIRF